MVISKATTVEECLEELPPERREAIEAVREVIPANLPEGYEEGIATVKRLDMGRSCVRFKRLDDLPLELIGEAVARTSVDDYLEMHRRATGGEAAAG
jgi:hypothetical protein